MQLKRFLALLGVFALSFQSSAQVVFSMSSADPKDDRAWAIERCQQLQSAVSRSIICGWQNDIQNILSGIPQAELNTGKTKIVDIFFEAPQSDFFMMKISTVVSEVENTDKNWMRIKFEHSKLMIAEILEENDALYKKTSYKLSSSALPKEVLRDWEKSQVSLRDWGKVKVDDRTTFRLDVDVAPTPQYGLLPGGSTELGWFIGATWKRTWK